jgi:hypothetical protein
VIKFDRSLITNINNVETYNIYKRKSIVNSKKVSVPKKDIFMHIFENAKKGNEMAVVILDEWQKFCKPKDETEKKVMHMIDKAAGEIFK